MRRGQRLELVAIEQAVFVTDAEQQGHWAGGIFGQTSRQHGAERSDAGTGGYQERIVGRLTQNKSAERTAHFDEVARLKAEQIGREVAVADAVQAQLEAVAIGRGGDKGELARQLGAHVYIDSAVDDPVAALQRMGGARAIVATSPSGQAIGPLVSALAVGGKLIVVGVPPDPIQVNAFSLVLGGRAIYGTLTGTAIDQEDTLAFSVLEQIRPMVETAPLEGAADAYARMMQGQARFRMVLVTKNAS